MLLLRSSTFIAILIGIIFITGSCIDSYAASRNIKYLYVEANEGNSSGGHTAIRFDNETFHFQHEHSGLLRIHRVDAESFNHAYAILGNRSIHESSIVVSEETYNLLLDGFNELLFIQDRQFAIYSLLQKDVILFEYLTRRVRADIGSNAPALPIENIGYFISGNTGNSLSNNSLSSSTVQLRSSIKTAYGDGFLEQRIISAEKAVNSLLLQSQRSAFMGLAPNNFPTEYRFASEEYEDSLLNLYALKVLLSANGLATGSFHAPEGASFSLTEEKRERLNLFSQKLERDLVKLVNSPRSDWGGAFIAGAARLAAIEMSLSSDRFVFLNRSSAESLSPIPRLPSRIVYLSEMKREEEQIFEYKWTEFLQSDELREADFAALELSGNRLVDLEHSALSGVFPRVIFNEVPSRTAFLTDTLMPSIDVETLASELLAAKQAEREYAKMLTGYYSYDLVSRNCVTEIFTSIGNILSKIAANTALEGMPDHLLTKRRFESIKRLGGYIDASRNLNFIPFVSSNAVDSCYSVSEKKDLPSYRSRRLAEMKKNESPLIVFFRESNTITSTLYNSSEKDSVFLFFTDDTLLLRPVFGVFNLLTGIGDSIIGLVSMPIYGADRLYRGSKGVLFSIPELFFFNVRKGTNDYIPDISLRDKVKQQKAGRELNESRPHEQMRD